MEQTTRKGVDMGAWWFTTYQQGSDLETAFNEAQEQARWESGNGGYTGTVAEKWGVTPISTAPTTLDEAIAESDGLTEDERLVDKWGPAGAIRVCDKENDGWLFFGWASS